MRIACLLGKGFDLVTSRQPDDLDAFSEASLSALGHASAPRA
jgi:hypothetical protein